MDDRRLRTHRAASTEVVPDKVVYPGGVGCSASPRPAPYSAKPGGVQRIPGAGHRECRQHTVRGWWRNQRAASSFLARVDDAMLRLVDHTGTKPYEFQSRRLGAVHAIAEVPVSSAYRGTARDYTHCFTTAC